MDLLIYFEIHFLLFAGFQLTYADQRNLQFQKKSTTSNLFGLGCAIEYWDKFQSRGVMVNPLTRECKALSESWFINQIQQAGFTYFQLRMTEDVFQPTAKALFKIPPLTMPEISVVLYFNSGYGLQRKSPSNDNQMVINIRATDYPNIGFRLAMRTIEGKFIFNSVYYGIWGEEIQRPSTVTDKRTIYKFEGKINPTNIQVYMDDVHVLDFPHRTNISNYQLIVAYTVNGAKTLQVQFYYPV